MPNVLIYSPDFDGHRQVYAFVLAHVLNELGFKIFIASNTKQILSNSFYIEKLKKIPGIELIDTSEYNEGGDMITSSEFLQLQNVCEVDLTVFTEADNHISLFVSQMLGKKNKFRGRSVGIFLRPFYLYEHNSLVEKLRYLKHLPSRWKNDDQLFHEIFLRRFSLLNVALYIDENFVTHHKYGKWLPDVFQQYADLIVKEEKSEQRSWIEKLDDFKEKNKGKFLLLYFGSPQFRRGYDTLLKIADENGDCFIHCGLRKSNEKFVYNVDELRSSLRKKGHLFETDQYIEDPLCIEYFFKSVSHLVLPYRNFFGSSGVMLQALSFGIPVMAPDKGIIGLRIKNYKLGITYNDKNVTSLITQFKKFIEIDPKTFKDSIEIYMHNQSAEQLKRVLINTFNVTG
jgi:glycosyltransferase involved in cell wall biosynthesis